MASSLMTEECGTVCKEIAEFSMKFVIMSLDMSDKGKENGFEDVLLAITFDGNVIKMENLEESEEGGLKNVGQELILQSTPENLAAKFRSSPIMFDLSRACNELGTYKLEITDCFIDALKCEEFKSETCKVDVTFIRDGIENAEMSLAYQVSRTTDGSLYKGLQSKMKKKKKNLVDTKSIDMENISDGFDDLTDSEINLTCDDTDLCPIDEEESADCRTTSFPISTSKSKSSRSKCCSDISKSQDCSSSQKTACTGCGGISISGITCVNKLSGFEKSKPCKSRSQSTIRSKGKCEASNKSRVCTECFEDLTVLPNNEACPKCTARSKHHHRLVSFKSENSKQCESQKMRECIKSIFEEIFIETKDRLVDDWKRLHHVTKKKTKPTDKNKQEKSNGNNSNQRCKKVLKARKQSRLTKSNGLRVKHTGVVLGHQCCQGNDSLVPKRMGWMWNVGVSERGWRPGAVRKSVAKIMKLYLTKPENLIKCPEKTNPPTLRVQKKNGQFTIVMNPLRDKTKVNEEISPIVFKLEKSEEAKKRSMARQVLKDRGVSSCDCVSLSKCNCMSACEKARIKFELMKVSNDFCLDRELTLCDLNDSSESEIDVEFTPPSAAKLCNPCFKRKPAKVSAAATQYETQVLEHKVVKDICGRSKSGKKDGNGKNGSDDDSGGETFIRPIRQVVKVLRDLPVKKCCNCASECNNFGCDVSYNHRFTTNYNPMYAQCPPQPPSCPNHFNYRPFCY